MKKFILGALFSLASLSMAQADIAETYQKSCATCHEAGALNAPKKGDRALWQQLNQQKGRDALIRAAHEGRHQMPAMGLCQSCSDKDLADLIEYMSN